MKHINNPNENGNIVIIGIIFIVIGAFLAFAGIRVYNLVQENDNEAEGTTTIEQGIDVNDDSIEETGEVSQVNDGSLEIADTGLSVSYDQNDWSVTDSDALYDYVLSSKSNFKLSIDLIETGEGGKGCADCIYEQLDTLTIEGSTYYLSVAGGYSSANNEASNVTLSASPTELVLPALNNGSQLFYQLVYFPGSPGTLSLNDAAFQEAIAVMKTISQ